MLPSRLGPSRVVNGQRHHPFQQVSRCKISPGRGSSWLSGRRHNGTIVTRPSPSPFAGLPRVAGHQVRGKKTKTVVNLDDLPQGIVRGRKTKTVVSLDDLPQGLIRPDPEAPLDEEPPVSPAYPTVVLQARRNMQKFDNCVLLTRVGGFYELYFEHAEEFGPLLNLKVAQKKTAAGPVPMVTNACSHPSRPPPPFLPPSVPDASRWHLVSYVFVLLPTGAVV